MKKILYICAKPLENWDIFTPLPSGDSAQNTISLLLLHHEQNLLNVSVSQVWNIYRGEKHHNEGNTQKSISYQEMLEQVFSHDLSVVI